MMANLALFQPSKLTEEQRLAIFEKKEFGKSSFPELAREYGVARSTIVRAYRHIKRLHDQFQRTGGIS